MQAREMLNALLSEVAEAVVSSCKHSGAFLSSADWSEFQQSIDPAKQVYLDTIAERTRSLSYTSVQAFRKDFEQILANALSCGDKQLVSWAQEMLDACCLELGAHYDALCAIKGFRLNRIHQSSESGDTTAPASPMSNMDALVTACEMAAEREGLLDELCVPHYYDDLMAEGGTAEDADEVSDQNHPNNCLAMAGTPGFLGAVWGGAPFAADLGHYAGTPDNFVAGAFKLNVDLEVEAEVAEEEEDETYEPKVRKAAGGGGGAHHRGGGAAAAKAPSPKQQAAKQQAHAPAGGGDGGSRYRRHKSKVFIRPNKVVYLPTTFMEDNFDASALPINCEMVVEAEGTELPERHMVTIKSVPRQGLSTMYCMTNVMKFQQQFLNWQILNWTRVDGGARIKIHLQPPSGVSVTGACSDKEQAPALAAAPAPKPHTAKAVHAAAPAARQVPAPASASRVMHHQAAERPFSAEPSVQRPPATSPAAHRTNGAPAQGLGGPDRSHERSHAGDKGSFAARPYSVPAAHPQHQRASTKHLNHHAPAAQRAPVQQQQQQASNGSTSPSPSSSGNCAGGVYGAGATSLSGLLPLQQQLQLTLQAALRTGGGGLLELDDVDSMPAQQQQQQHHAHRHALASQHQQLQQLLAQQQLQQQILCLQQQQQQQQVSVAHQPGAAMHLLPSMMGLDMGASSSGLNIGVGGSINVGGNIILAGQGGNGALVCGPAALKQLFGLLGGLQQAGGVHLAGAGQL